jgi:hypothetical protein
MPTVRQLAVLRALYLAGEGATFKLNEDDFAVCVQNGWLTQEGELTVGGKRLLLEETSGED